MTNLRMVARVNGAGSVGGIVERDALHLRPARRPRLAKSETIYPGELWGSRTVTNGCGLELGRYLEPGDVVELEVEGIGNLPAQPRRSSRGSVSGWEGREERPMPFVVVAHYYAAKEGKADEIAAIPEGNAGERCPDRSRAGSVYYVNRSQDDPRKLLLYEQYPARSREDYEAHKATPYFQEKILNTVVPMLESRVPEFYDLIEPE